MDSILLFKHLGWQLHYLSVFELDPTSSWGALPLLMLHFDRAIQNGILMDNEITFLIITLLRIPICHGDTLESHGGVELKLPGVGHD